MKRIIRLTESDLTRIVKRVISENNRSLLREGVGATAAKKLYDALSGNFFDDNEAQALIAVKMIKNCDDLKEFAKQIHKLSGKPLNKYIDSEMSAVDVEYDKIVAYWSKIATNCVKPDEKYDSKRSIDFNDDYTSWNGVLQWLKGSQRGISY